MKKTLLTTALLAMLGGLAPAAFAQADHAAHHGAESAPVVAEARLAEGTVKKIDKSAGKLTIAHGPLESLGMPPMTMVFRAAEPGLLDQVMVRLPMRTRTRSPLRTLSESMPGNARLFQVHRLKSSMVLTLGT